MRYASSSFFHYTRSLDAVKKILEGGFGIYYCKEELYSEKGAVNHIGIPMACFCDIPLGFISANNYGKYVIGMKRSWGFRVGLLPVLYYPNNKRCLSTRDIIRATNAFLTRPDDTSAYSMLGYAKPMLKIEPSDLHKPHSRKNYLEREWRKVYSPSSSLRWKTEAEYDIYRGIQSLPKQSVGTPLRFDVKDIDMIIVPDAEIQDLISFVSGTSLKKFSGKATPLSKSQKHLTTVIAIIDKDSRQRTFDLKRSERLHWIRYHIEGHKADNMLVFSVEEPEGIRTYIYDKDEQYVIVLEPLRNKGEYYLLSAYYLEGKDKARDKMARKYRRRLPDLL